MKEIILLPFEETPLCLGIKLDIPMMGDLRKVILRSVWPRIRVVLFLTLVSGLLPSAAAAPRGRLSVLDNVCI